MKHQHFLTRLVISSAMAVTAALASGCTMKSAEAPPLTGPAEFGKSISVSVSPDVLSQDGASQSVVTVTARGPNGQPLQESLRAEINVGGVFADFGALSARNIVTGSDGRATFVYTAPAAPAAAVDTNTTVSIVVTPVGTDYNNSTPRFATIRLVPPGVVQPPANLTPTFTLTPGTPEDNQTVLFEACATPCAPASNPVATYTWSFGDGGSATGRTTQHQYTTAGTYVVTLRITDSAGRSATTSKSVNVAASTLPTASFVMSPAAPRAGWSVSFNASSSFSSEPGRAIASYTWDFGDGSPLVHTSNEIVYHSFSAAATYNVTLVVTDNAGRKSVGVTRALTILP